MYHSKDSSRLIQLSRHRILSTTTNFEMKLTLAVVLIGAVVAGSYGAPASNAVDWDGVSSRVRGIQSTIEANYQRIATIAKTDNPSVGAIIEGKLEEKTAVIRLTLNQINAAISARSLTESQAQAYLGKVATILHGTLRDIQDDVNKLSTHLHSTIYDLLSGTRADVQRLSNEIFGLLRQ